MSVMLADSGGHPTKQRGGHKDRRANHPTKPENKDRRSYTGAPVD